MANLKQIRTRIVSVKKTQQITSAMRMVAAAKMRRAQENILRARPYAHKLREVMAHLARVTDAQMHPLFARREPRRVLLVVVTGDRGLCGGFNNNIIRTAQHFIDDFRGDELQLFTVGRKGDDFFKKRTTPIMERLISFFNDLDFGHAVTLGQKVMELYGGGELDQVMVLYNEFKSAVRQDVILEELLPVDPTLVEEEECKQEFLYEPDAMSVLKSIVPLHINNQFWRILLESNAAEQAARMTAMESATDNAEEMIRELTLHFNRARQAAITQEISEIVGGAEAIQ